MMIADISLLRRVLRAITDIRHGTPVLLAGDPVQVVLPVDTATDATLAELAHISTTPAVLLLSSVRAAVLAGHTPDDADTVVAFPISDTFWNLAALRALADPTIASNRQTTAAFVGLPVNADAAIQLVKLARLLPALLMAPARAPLPALLTVDPADVGAYPVLAAQSLTIVADAAVPLDGAPHTRVIAFRAADGGQEHLAIVVGDPAAVDAPLVRLHSECFTGDLLGSLRCDCGEQLRGAIHRLGREGAGVLLYLAQEGRGIGLVNKLLAYNLQDRAENGMDTLDANRELGWRADERDYTAAATMLQLLGLRRVRLLTNNPAKLAALQRGGIEIAAREPHQVAPNGVNDGYLATKAGRFGHLLG